MDRFCRTLTVILVLSVGSLSAHQAFAQSSRPENSDTIRGTVVNSLTHEPIARALVLSPDNRLATMTDGQGRFEFNFPQTGAVKQSDSSSIGTDSSSSRRAQFNVANRSYPLVARKPGFLPDQSNYMQNSAAEELTIALVPEALIVGRLALPTSEDPDSISLQIYRREVQNGRAHWIPAGSTQSKLNGEFRFAELPAGTYKLLTGELLDRDPLTFDPRGQLYGYPPVYYPNATDFASATPIQLSAGETVECNLSLVRQPYYRIKVEVTGAQPGAGIGVNVLQGRRGPGYSLGYNGRDQTIEGMLPNGTYTIEVSSPGPNAASGLLYITIKGAAVEGARITLLPTASITIKVKEEFRSQDHTGSVTFSSGGRSFILRGPRRYLNVTLEPAEDFGRGGPAGLGSPTGPGDESLVIENVQPGRYWVRVNSSRGFASSVRSGSTDLQHQPLVIGAGGSAAPIEITMRDDTAEIDGSVEGVASPSSTSNNTTDGDGGLVSDGHAAMPTSSAHVYCIPQPDSSGEFTDVWVSPDGSFRSAQLPPGVYRLLAFDRALPELEYLNPEAIEAYEAKGPLVRVVGGQKEHVQLQLISTRE